MAKNYRLSLFILAIILSACCVQDSKGVFGILTPKEGKRGFATESLNRQALTLQAIQEKLRKTKVSNAVILKMVMLFVNLAN